MAVWRTHRGCRVYAMHTCVVDSSDEALMINRKRGRGGTRLIARPPHGRLMRRGQSRPCAGAACRRTPGDGDARSSEGSGIWCVAMIARTRGHTATSATGRAARSTGRGRRGGVRRHIPVQADASPVNVAPRPSRRSRCLLRRMGWPSDDGLYYVELLVHRLRAQMVVCDHNKQRGTVRRG